tara:strand:+ start:314 stop:493 length:180 start_codon:yes stop_codon:yes gene_type:complete
MSRVIKRPGRKGFYLQKTVPRDTRFIFKTSSTIRKLGNSKDESLKNISIIENNIQNQFL